MRYPIIPPKTENSVARLAKKSAFCLLANDIGINTMSGGKGKIIASQNATKLSTKGANFVLE